MIKTYYMMTKPGIIFGNIVTTIAGLGLASHGNICFSLVIMTLLGLSLVVASGCVCNNYIDRNMDAKMQRTKNRALVVQAISNTNALIFALLLHITGLGILLAWTNPLTTCVALFGFIWYVIIYGISKRKTSFGTLIGSVAGALPPVVGYCAVSNTIDLGAFLIFSVVTLWQMPHFFAIAIYRFSDYAAANIPVLPLTRGILVTKIHMLLYMIAFVVATTLLTVCGYTGYIYLTAAVVLDAMWLILCIRGFSTQDSQVWAKKIFLFSLVIIFTLCSIIPFDTARV